MHAKKIRIYSSPYSCFHCNLAAEYSSVDNTSPGSQWRSHGGVWGVRTPHFLKIWVS